ncbi:MAG: hypothetical protein ACLQGP_27205, partial [Isosphaeraceae bacterium]
DQRPTLTLSLPLPGDNSPLDRILVGMYDSGGLDPESFRVVASFAVEGVAAGKDLSSRFRARSRGVWELNLGTPLTVASGTLTVFVRDRQGNESRVERIFSAGRDGMH